MPNGRRSCSARPNYNTRTASSTSSSDRIRTPDATITAGDRDQLLSRTKTGHTSEYVWRNRTSSQNSPGWVGDAATQTKWTHENRENEKNGENEQAREKTGGRVLLRRPANEVQVLGRGKGHSNLRWCPSKSVTTMTRIPTFTEIYGVLDAAQETCKK